MVVISVFRNAEGLGELSTVNSFHLDIRIALSNKLSNPFMREADDSIVKLFTSCSTSVAWQ